MSRIEETFDAQKEVKIIRTRRAEARRKLYHKSRLDRYRTELVALKRAGASCADLVEWLRVNHRLKIHRSSIDRYLRKLPELKILIVETGSENNYLAQARPDHAELPFR